MTIIINDNMFVKDMENFIKYSEGFLKGAQLGKKTFLKEMSESIIESLKEFVDSNARTDPATLHHVYEWYQTGMSNGRLFDFDSIVSDTGISFSYKFRQSNTIKDGSSVPFYDKAKIMEEGMAVTIKPVNAKVLNFTVDSEEIFTSNPITVDNPGGDQVAGSFEKTVENFFEVYFKQSFLEASGIRSRLQSPVEFSEMMSKRSNLSTGIEAGKKWMASSGKGIL